MTTRSLPNAKPRLTNRLNRLNILSGSGSGPNLAVISSLYLKLTLALFLSSRLFSESLCGLSVTCEYLSLLPLYAYYIRTHQSPLLPSQFHSPLLTHKFPICMLLPGNGPKLPINKP